jgi:hypothetical protein
MKTLFKICCLIFMIPFVTNAEELGRLFFTPAQRALMDYNYARNTKPEDNANSLMLNGIVQMHGGKRTAWINGTPQSVGHSDENTPERVSVPIPGQKKSVKLKVGQRVLLNPSASPDATQSGSSGTGSAK